MDDAIESSQDDSPIGIYDGAVAWSTSFASLARKTTKTVAQSVRQHTWKVWESLSTLTPAEEGQHNVPPRSQQLSATAYCRESPGAVRGFSFSPAGLLLPYHLGVIAYLRHAGVLTPDTPLSGASAGAIAITIAALEMPPTTVMEAVYRLEAELRHGGTRGRLKKLLEKELRLLLPDNCHSSISDRRTPACVVYTLVKHWKPKIVTQFVNKDDVIECILASCNIPFYFGRGPVLECRGQWAVDGYFSDRKNFGCPPLEYCDKLIRVTPFCKRQVLNHLPDWDVISPDLAKYDDRIPKESFKKFLDYLACDPAPKPSHLPDPYVPESTNRFADHENQHRSRCSQRRQCHRSQSMPALSHAKISSSAVILSFKAPTIVGNHWRSRSHTLCANRPRDSAMVVSASDVGDEGVVNFTASPRRDEDETTFCKLLHIDFLRQFADNVAPNNTIRQCDSRGNTSLPRISSHKKTRRRSSQTNSSLANVRSISTEMMKKNPRRKVSHFRSSSLTGQAESAKGSRLWGFSSSKTQSRFLENGLLRFTFTWKDLLNYALKPTPSDGILTDLFDLGRADAFRWYCLNHTRNNPPSSSSSTPTHSRIAAPLIYNIDQVQTP